MKTVHGIILIDILLALSLGFMFIISLTSITGYSRDIFYKARDKSGELDVYEQRALTSHDAFHGFSVKPYGNDREEETYSSSSIMFTSIRVLSGGNIDSVDQHALCSVDFSDDSVIGSYEWLRNRNESTSTYSLNVNVRTYDLPLAPTTPMTDLEVRGDIAYVSTDSNAAALPDIYIFKLGDKENVKMVSSLNTGPGIDNFAMAGSFIYAAVPSTVGQLHVLKQDPSHNLSLLSRYRLLLPYATATPALGSSIAYDDGIVFLGTEKWAGEEFLAIDIGDPFTPVKLSGVEIGGKVGDIFVHAGKAYVSGADRLQLRSIDVRDPSSPLFLSGFSPSGWQRQEGKTSSLFEGRLDFGRTSGGYNIVSDAEAFTFARSSPFVDTDVKSADISQGVYGIISDRLHEFIITRQAGREFQIYDHTMSASSSLQFSLPTLPQAMTCYGNRIYILSHTIPAIYAITITRNYTNI